jgi:hypothetical protein
MKYGKKSIFSTLLSLLFFVMVQRAVASTSKSIISNDPTGQYYLIKSTLSKMLAAEQIEFIDGLYPEPFDLIDCSTGGTGYTLSDESYRDDYVKILTALAYDILRLRISLTNIGYPEFIWRPLLVQMESEQLILRLNEIGFQYKGESPSNKHFNRFLRNIRHRLEDYRQHNNRRLQEVVVEGECGDAGSEVKIKTEPPNGRVMFITVFLHKFCEAQQLNPDDPSRCDHWIERKQGMTFDALGDYFYFAFWPDGKQQRGRLSFTNYMEEIETIVFRKNETTRHNRSQ